MTPRLHALRRGARVISNDPPMSKIASICRGVVFLYLAFLLFITLEQLKDFGGWIRFVALILRLALFGFLGWKVWQGSKAATLALGAVFALIAGVVAVQLYQRQGHFSSVSIRLGGQQVTAVMAFGTMCVFSLLNSAACFVLARELKHDRANPMPVPEVSRPS